MWLQGVNEKKVAQSEDTIIVDWMSMSPQKSYIDVLVTKVKVLGGGGLWEVIRSWGWNPHEGISAIIKETQESSLSPLSPREQDG